MRKPHPTKSTYDEVETLLDTLCRLYAEGVPVDWEGFHAFHPREKATLPSYPFQRKPYWFSKKPASTSLHPLLGRKVDLPYGGEESHFQNPDLNLKTLPSYMRDHQIGTLTLFPAAGFFELFLAASSAHEEGTGFPLSLEDAFITRALLLWDDGIIDEDERVSLHTQLSLDDGKTKIQVFSRKDRTGAKWILHARAFLENGSCVFKDQGSIVDERVLKSLRDPSFEGKGNMSDLYLSMKSAGYNFGPSFQSVRRTWQGPSSSFLSEIRFPLVHHNEEDLLPPIVMDGMLQSFLISKMEDEINENKILLPVGFRHFTLLCRWKPERDSKMMREAVFYVHIPSTLMEAQAVVIVLYSEGGTPLAVMKELFFVPTSISTLERIIRQGDLKAMPLIPLYSEDWIADANHGSGRAALHSQIDLADVQLLMENMNTVVVEREDDRFIGLAILETFMKLGVLDSKFFELEHFVKEFNIRPDLTLTVQRLMDILMEDGFASWSIIVPAFSLHPGLPSLADIREEMSRVIIEKVSYDFSAIQFFCSKLPSFLLGEELIQDTLFATKGSHPYSAKSLSFGEKELQDGMTSILHLILSKAYNDGEGVLRILEIGAGTSGGATRSLLDLLTKMCVKFEYDYATTTSSLVAAEAEIGPTVNYRVLDIESDPKPQGFPPSHYDLVIADKVLHTSRDVTEGTANIRHLLLPNGFLLLREAFQPSRFRDIVFGLLPSYWNFKDTSLRPRHCVLGREGWESVLRKVGFQDVVISGKREGLILAQCRPESVSYVHNYPRKTWTLFDCRDEDLLLQKLQMSIEFYGDKVAHTRDAHGLSDNFVGLILPAWTMGTCPISAVKSLLEVSLSLLSITSTTMHLPKIILLTRGAVCVSPEESVSPEHSPLVGFIRVFMSENPGAWVKIIDFGLDDCNPDREVGQIISELWTHFGEPMVAYREGRRYLPRLRKVRQLSIFPPLDVDMSVILGRFHMVLPPSNLLADISFAQDHTRPRELAEDEVEIGIRATGLNFRDLLIVLKPIEEFGSINNFGMDVSGEVVRVGAGVTRVKMGDPVMADRSFELNVPLSSHVIKKEGNVVKMPPNMTFEEAATLPIVFATAYACLKTLGRLQPGETLLIHTASGGVGLAVIQMAQRIGARILGTAGSLKKRAYLRSIGVQTVFNSRDTAFAQGVLDATDALGVDLVINTLTSDGFIEASLSCLKNGSRFLEIGKLGIWTEEKVQSVRPDVFYAVLDFFQAKGTWANESWFRGMLDHLKSCKPIPYTRFFLPDVRGALRHMEKAKHIGKIILTMPTGEGSYHLFNKVSTYIVTGGTGGIGFQVGRWITENGGKHVLLVGRKPISEENQKILDDLNHGGEKCVVTIQADVGDLEACRGIMTYIQENSLPPLRGIMHAAGVLSDGIINNQTRDKFELVLHPKVRGTLNLHEVSKGCQLEQFVMFSSITGIIGTPGQSNYAAGNAFLDGFAHYRRSLGLVASTVNWGLWGEVGIGVGLNVNFASSHNTQEGLSALEAVLRYNMGQVSPAVIHPAEVLKVCPWLDKIIQTVLTETPDNKYLSKDTGVGSSGRFWKEFTSAQGDEGKKEALVTYIEKTIRCVLGLSVEESIDENQGFLEMGMDSLMLIELRNEIQAGIGKDFTLSAAVMIQCKTLAMTKDVMYDLLCPTETTAEEADTGNGIRGW